MCGCACAWARASVCLRLHACLCVCVAFCMRVCGCNSHNTRFGVAGPVPCLPFSLSAALSDATRMAGVAACLRPLPRLRRAARAGTREGGGHQRISFVAFCSLLRTPLYRVGSPRLAHFANAHGLFPLPSPLALSRLLRCNHAPPRVVCFHRECAIFHFSSLCGLPFFLALLASQLVTRLACVCLYVFLRVCLSVRVYFWSAAHSPVPLLWCCCFRCSIFVTRPLPGLPLPPLSLLPPRRLPPPHTSSPRPFSLLVCPPPPTSCAVYPCPPAMTFPRVSPHLDRCFSLALPLSRLPSTRMLAPYPHSVLSIGKSCVCLLALIFP